MEFKKFSKAVAARIKEMRQDNSLYLVDVTKDDLWNTYLNSFPEGSNPMYLERTEHDCNCCKRFIRAVGGMVTLRNGVVESIWGGAEIAALGSPYAVVAQALDTLVLGAEVRTRFLSDTKQLGDKTTQQALAGGDVKTWDHFYGTLLDRHVLPAFAISIEVGKYASNYGVFRRGLTEITLDSLETVQDLIAQKSIYRGAEFSKVLKTFTTLKRKFQEDVDASDSKAVNIYCWEQLGTHPTSITKFRNSVIGTLVTDLSDGVPLDNAVASFESKVAPQNYKRTTALVTTRMIGEAETKVRELGLQNSLQRRYATLDDITINNVLFADRSVKAALSGDVFSEMKKEAGAMSARSFKSVAEVSITDFLEKVVPTATALEVLVENPHLTNLMSLIAPEDNTAPNILSWANNFSWTYASNVTDAIKQNVVAAGGKVDGVLRFSLQWNEDNTNPDDLDAHCVQPDGHPVIYHANKGRRHKSSGMLDIDVVTPGNKVAVENIIYTNIRKMPEGTYQFQVHNFHEGLGVRKGGFSAEIEVEGEIYSFYYPNPMRQKSTILVAEVDYSKKDGFTVRPSLPSNSKVRNSWGITTQQFHKVQSLMLSPNHWDDNNIGNKHYFFMLEDCVNPEKARGLYNEFLNPVLQPHRKVFEVLGDKLKTPKSDQQLSGLGFSSTRSDHLYCKVSGTSERIVKVVF